MASGPTRAFVYPIKEHAAEVLKIEEFIKRACTLVCEQATQSSAQKCLKEADVLVVLICTQTNNNPTLETLALTANNSGKRIVGVWGSETAPLPTAIHKYGSALIPLEAESIKQAVCGGQSIWLTPGGEERSKPKTPRHNG